MKIVPFPFEKINDLLSWVNNYEEKQFWAGNTFQEGLNKDIFLIHLKRKDLYPFAFINSDELLAYGEIIENDKNSGILCRVIVRAKNRKKGIGKKFTGEIVKWAFTQKFLKTIRLNTYGDNLAARKCYRSIGFKEIACKKKFRLVANKWKDLIIMEKKSSNLLQ